MKTIIKHIAGYAIGFIVFILVIPHWQYNLSIKEYTTFQDELFDSTLLRYLLSIPLFISGVVFAAWSNRFLFEFGKGGPFDLFNYAISPRSKNLLVNGPYRYCRNPMVFGSVCLYASIGIYLNSIRGLLVALGFLFLMIIYVKTVEERRLVKDFGDEYKEYRKRVPMIFPIAGKKK